MAHPASNLRVPTCPFSDAQMAEMRKLWETRPDLSATAIAELLGTTRNQVIGYAHRRRWEPRRAVPTSSTVFTRMDALHAHMDAVLAETRPWVEDRKPIMVRTWADDDRRRLKQSARLRALGGNLRQRGAA